MVFCFVQNFFFGQYKSQNIYFFCRAKRQFFFPELNIRLYDKNSETDYFFFLHQNQNIFFSNIGNQYIFLEKNHNPPFKLNGHSLIMFIPFGFIVPKDCYRSFVFQYFDTEIYLMKVIPEMCHKHNKNKLKSAGFPTSQSLSYFQ